MKSIEWKMTKHNQMKVDFIAAKTRTTKYFCTYIICISRKVLHLDLSNSVSLYFNKKKWEKKNYFSAFQMLIGNKEKRETDFHTKAHTYTLHTYTLHV